MLSVLWVLFAFIVSQFRSRQSQLLHQNDPPALNLIEPGILPGRVMIDPPIWPDFFPLYRENKVVVAMRHAGAVLSVFDSGLAPPCEGIRCVHTTHGACKDVRLRAPVVLTAACGCGAMGWYDFCDGTLQDSDNVRERVVSYIEEKSYGI